VKEVPLVRHSDDVIPEEFRGRLLVLDQSESQDAVLIFVGALKVAPPGQVLFVSALDR